MDILSSPFPFSLHPFSLIKVTLFSSALALSLLADPLPDFVDGSFLVVICLPSSRSSFPSRPSLPSSYLEIFILSSTREIEDFLRMSM